MQRVLPPLTVGPPTSSTIPVMSLLSLSEDGCTLLVKKFLSILDLHFKGKFHMPVHDDVVRSSPWQQCVFVYSCNKRCSNKTSAACGSLFHNHLLLPLQKWGGDTAPSLPLCSGSPGTFHWWDSISDT